MNTNCIAIWLDEDDEDQPRYMAMCAIESLTGPVRIDANWAAQDWETHQRETHWS